MADVAINADTVDIPSINFAQQGADVAAPAAGRWQLYFKAGGLYARNAAGTVVGPFSTGGDVATDPIWDAAGDIVQGTGANTAARLAIGTALQVPRVNAGATALEYATPLGYRLAQTVLGTTAASFSFASIPATFTNLLVVLSGRSDRAAAELDQIGLRFNNDTGANYTDRDDYNQTQANHTGQTFIGAGYLPAATAVANHAGQLVIEIAGYAGTTFYKTATCKGGYHQAGTTQVLTYGYGNWLNTAAINRVDVVGLNSNFIAGTICTLYGLL